MNHYELLYLIDVPKSEQDLETIASRVAAVIKEYKGEIAHAESLGRKKLGYPIKKLQQAVYNVVEFDLPGNELTKLGQTLKLDNDVIRFQIIKIKKRTAEDRKPAEFVSNETEETRKPEKSDKPEKKEIKQEIKTKQEVLADEKEALSTEELDKKLDEILKDDIIK